MAEADRAAQLVVIEEQGQRLGVVAGERNVLQAQLGAVQQQLEGVEADRAARLVVIEEQGQRLGAVAGERNVLQAQLGAVQQQLEVAEADRAARLAVIEEQGQRLGVLAGERNVLQAQLGAAQQQLEAVEADRAARLGVIEEQGQRLGVLAGEHNVLQASWSSAAAVGGGGGGSSGAAGGDRGAGATAGGLASSNWRRSGGEADQAARLSTLEGERHTLLTQLRALQDMLQILRRTRIYRLLHLCRRWRFIEQTVLQASAIQTRGIGSGDALPTKNSSGGTALQVLMCFLYSTKRFTHAGIRFLGTWMRH